MFLPDDIMICILGRLDVRDVVRYRCVCKRWNDLTYTTELEFEVPMSKLPMIVAKEDGESFIDKWWVKRNLITLKDIGSTCNSVYCLPYCSQNGFILTRIKVKVGYYQYIIHNPVTREKVKIVLHNEPDAHAIFGVYLHPVRKEYCTLWEFLVVVDGDSHGIRVQYKMLNLESKPPLWRNIGLPWKHMTRWRAIANPICLNHNFIYWLVYDNIKKKISIMEFDIKTEGLAEMPLPNPISNDDKFTSSSLVINDEGCLNLVRVVVDYKDITVKIWRLEEGRYWTESHYVCYQKLWGIIRTYNYNGPIAVAIANNELVFYSTVRIESEYCLSISKGLFVCNLETAGTLRKLVETKYEETTWFIPHHPTIASLRKCQPLIYI